MAKAVDNWTFALRAATGQPLPPAEGDARYGGEAWAHWPFNVYARSYRNYVDWWQQAWSNVPGVTPENERTLDFVARNALEAISPANFLSTNPELLDTTRAEAGEPIWCADSAIGSRTSSVRSAARSRTKLQNSSSAAISPRHPAKS